jgi:hypothetical protein
MGPRKGDTGSGLRTRMLVSLDADLFARVLSALRGVGRRNRRLPGRVAARESNKDLEDTGAVTGTGMNDGRCR